MKAVAKLCVLIGVAAGLVGCGIQAGSGRYIEEVRETNGFTRVEISDGLAAEIAVGEAQEVRLTGDDDLVRQIRTEVRSGTLYVEFPEHYAWVSEIGLVVKIAAPEVTRVDRSGGGRLEVWGIHGEAFECHGSGGGNVTLSGVAERLVLDTSGGTSTDARELAARSADVAMSGGGASRVQVSDELAVELSGGARLTVAGRPAMVRSDLSGGSQVLTE